MKKKYYLDILYYLFFTVTSILLCVFQNSTWISLFQLHLTPQFWIFLISYLSVYKNIYIAIPMIYVVSFIYSSSTSLPFGKLICFGSVIFLTSLFMQAFKLKSKKIFLFYCIVCTAIFPFCDIILSSLLFAESIYIYSILQWIWVTLLTTICIIPIAFLFWKLDRYMYILKMPKEERIRKSLNEIPYG